MLVDSFLITYLMHTTHAAKYGSRVGLGLTLIQVQKLRFRISTSFELTGFGSQYGSYRASVDEPPMDDVTFYNGNGTVTGWPGQIDPPSSLPNGTLPDGLTPTEYARLEESWAASGEWMSFLMMTTGISNSE
jgi:hypothetical protein